MAIDKRKQALAALDNHARRYQVSIPTSLTAFYESDFMKHNERFVHAGIETYGEATFQLTMTPPTWLNKADDAINGPQGEWSEAKSFLPIFTAEQNLYVVVDLRTADLQVGWCQDAEFERDEEGYRDGVEQEEANLSDFLLGLTLDAGNAENVFEAMDDCDEDWQEDFGDDGPRAFDVDH